MDGGQTISNVGTLGIGMQDKPHQQRNYHIEVKEINNGWTVTCGSETIHCPDFEAVRVALTDLHSIFFEARINNLEQFNKMKEANLKG